MKKVLVICFFMMFVMAGCGSKTPPVVEPVINQDNVNDVVDSIEILYAEFDILDYEDEYIQGEIERIRKLYDSFNQDEKNLVNNLDKFEAIEKAYQDYKDAVAAEEAEKQKIQDAVNEAAELAANAVPASTAGENIDLPSSYTSEDGVHVYIGWKTNDPYTITNDGVVTQPRKTGKRVTLTATVRSGNVSETINKTVVVGPIGYTMLPDKPVFAYYYTNQRSLTEIERETINVIILSFGRIAEDGTVSVSGLNYETVLKERKHGIRVMFSVQNKDGFKNWTSTAEKREQLAQNFLDTCKTYHFDGVDIDWEYPESGIEVSNYVEFMKVLYKKMKAYNSEYLVTSAMYGGNGVSKYNAGESYKYMDYIQLMTYDLNAKEVAQHLTALSASKNGYSSAKQTVEFYKGAGIPLDKLIIGCGFYGKIYELSTSGSTFIGEKPIQDPYTIVYSNIRNTYLSKVGQTDSRMKVERKWDATAQAPYLCVTEYGTAGNVTGRKFITYDDTESVTLKSEYVFDMGLGGIMFWELGYEDRETDDLIHAIHDVFYK